MASPPDDGSNKSGRAETATSIPSTDAGLSTDRSDEALTSSTDLIDGPLAREIRELVADAANRTDEALTSSALGIDEALISTIDLLDRHTRGDRDATSSSSRARCLGCIDGLTGVDEESRRISSTHAISYKTW